MQEFLRSEDLLAADALCIAGGDGTIRDCLTALLSRGDAYRPAIGILPIGTGNSVLSHLGDDGLEASIERIAAGRTQPFDVMRVECDGQVSYCANIVGLGAAARISRNAERWRLFGALRYRLAAIWEVATARPMPLTIECDGERLDDRFLLALATNTRYAGRKMFVAPQARTDDGVLDLLLARKASRLQMLELFQRIDDGSHAGLPFVEWRTASRLSIAAGQAGPVTLDGDVRIARSISIEMLPAAVQVFA